MSRQKGARSRERSGEKDEREREVSVREGSETASRLKVVEREVKPFALVRSPCVYYVYPPPKNSKARERRGKDRSEEEEGTTTSGSS